DLTRDLVERLTIVYGPAVFPEKKGCMTLQPRVAVDRARGTGIDGDVPAREGENEQRHQHVLLDWRAGERLVQRIGAEVPDHLDPLARHVRTGLGSDQPRVCTCGVGCITLALRLLCLGHAI